MRTSAALEEGDDDDDDMTMVAATVVMGGSGSAQRVQTEAAELRMPELHEQMAEAALRDARLAVEEAINKDKEAPSALAATTASKTAELDEDDWEIAR